MTRALVLIAGLATRLRPLSFVRAKAALPVAGVPIMIRILRQLEGAGFTDAVLNLHHRPDTLTRLVGDGSGWHGVTLRPADGELLPGEKEYAGMAIGAL